MTTVAILHGVQNRAPTMSSREIAELTEKSLSHVHRDLVKMMEDVPADDPERDHVVYETDSRGYMSCVHLPKELSLTLVAGYSVPMRRAIIKRWQELEAKASAPVHAELSRMDILQIAMQAEKERLIAIEQRDEAIRTKAEIGSRREATAMATASKAVQEMKALRIQLSKSKDYQTVLAMQKKYGAAFVPTIAYFKLRAWCREHDHPPIDVPCDRYGQVKSWPAQAWMAVYGLSV